MSGTERETIEVIPDPKSFDIIQLLHISTVGGYTRIYIYIQVGTHERTDSDYLRINLNLNSVSVFLRR